MAEKLKPCPFCGGEAHIDSDYSSELDHTFWQVWHDCDTNPGPVRHTYGHALGMEISTPWCASEDAAVALWNRRAERTCRMEAFLLGEFFTGHRLTTSTDMSDDEMDALLEKLREDTIIRCSACHFSVPDGANVSYEQSDDGTWSVSGCEPRANYCAHCGARVVKEEA